MAAQRGQLPLLKSMQACGCRSGFSKMSMQDAAVPVLVAVLSAAAHSIIIACRGLWAWGVLRLRECGVGCAFDLAGGHRFLVDRII